MNEARSGVLAALLAKQGTAVAESTLDGRFGFLRVIAGLIYLDRYDVNILPAGGLIWTPSDDQRHEIVFPRPRLAWRVAESDRAAVDDCLLEFASR